VFNVPRRPRLVRANLRFSGCISTLRTTRLIAVGESTSGHAHRRSDEIHGTLPPGDIDGESLLMSAGCVTKSGCTNRAWVSLADVHNVIVYLPDTRLC